MTEHSEMQAEILRLRALLEKAQENSDRLDGLLSLTDREDSNGRFRVVLEYDNYHDVALVIHDGTVLGSQGPLHEDFDGSVLANDQFRLAIDMAIEEGESVDREPG